MILCINCSHQSVCEDGLAHISNKDIVDDCHFYEKERVKCEDCLVGIITDNLIYRSADIEGVFFDSKFKFCPKCGTEIKILEKEPA